MNHKFNLTPAFEKYSNIHNIDGDISESVDYSVMKAPYEIRTDTICGFSNTIVVNKSNEESVLTNDASTWFVQEDYGTNDLADNNNIRPHYIYMPVKHDNTNILNVKNEEVGIMRTDNNNEKIIDRFSVVDYLNNAYDTTDYQGRASSPFLLKYLNEASKDDRTVDEKVQEYMNSF